MIDLEGFEDITHEKNGRLLKKVINSGNGPKPCPGNIVLCDYTGYFHSSGEKFDSSIDSGSPLEFSIGNEMVIKGWDIAVLNMQVGEKSKFFIHNKYAYGSIGMNPKVPPNSDLVFEIHLISFREEDLSPNKDGFILRTILEKGAGHTGPQDGGRVEISLCGRCNGTTFDERKVNFILADDQ